MECKFISHGIAISYDHIVKPCCVWRGGSSWADVSRIEQINLVSWHNSTTMQSFKNQLATGVMPLQCGVCDQIEQSGRYDSTRGNGNNSYKHYQHDDITLEIRPGNTCNFACQTCWPAASSRVAQYYQQAGIINAVTESRRIDNFDFLLPIAPRIKDVVLLGGEPFYDKSCRKFLTWASNNLSATLVLFTNGSVVDFDLIQQYPGKIILVFSLDAVGQHAEYIRPGAAWDLVWSNYNRLKEYNNIERRVNITCSVFNYAYLAPLLDLLCKDWPSVVSFGTPPEKHFNEVAIPQIHRQYVIDRISPVIPKLESANIESGQKSNAINALQTIINNLQTAKWDQDAHAKLVDLVRRLDRVKNLSIDEMCPEVAAWL